MRPLLALLVLLSAFAVGCGEDEESPPPGGGTGGGGRAPGAEITPNLLRGARFAVGSKEFTEQLVLGQITAEALRAAGALVTDRTGIQGSEATRRALTSGEVDMYWEYTGTAQLVHLDQQPISDPARQYAAVARADRANGVEWLAPAPANNAFALAVRREAVRPLGVRTISDLAGLLRRNRRDASLCVAREFRERADGLPGLERAYGLRYPRDLLVLMRDEGEIYAEVDRGGRCNVGEVFLTDGRIVANELFVLEDDKRFFTSYNPALTARAEVMRANPRLRQIFDPIAEQLTTDELRALNAQVDVEGQRPEEVARRWLDDNGFTG